MLADKNRATDGMVYHRRYRQRRLYNAHRVLQIPDQLLFCGTDEKISATDQIDTLVEKGIGAGQFNRYRQFITGTDQTIILERNKKNELEKILDKKRQALQQKTIDKKSLERLREKQEREYTHEMLREEQKSLDEIASLKTAREVNNERT